jgi:hypothetical protein
VLLFHSTPVFGCLSADGLWHGEPALTLARKALATPTQLPLSDNLRVLKHMWAMLRKYTDRGFTFIAELDVPHDCGIHWSCPCTFRTTNDAGCLEMPFPLFPFPGPPTAHTGSWLLGVSACSTHNISGGLPVHSPSSYKGTFPLLFMSTTSQTTTDTRWPHLFRGLLAMDSEPQDVLEVLMNSTRSVTSS